RSFVRESVPATTQAELLSVEDRRHTLPRTARPQFCNSGRPWLPARLRGESCFESNRSWTQFAPAQKGVRTRAVSRCIAGTFHCSLANSCFTFGITLPYWATDAFARNASKCAR